MGNIMLFKSNNDSAVDEANEKKRLSKVFNLLRKDGFVAKENFWCCKSCAWKALSDFPDGTNIIFYSKKEAEAFNKGDLTCPLYISFDGDANKIIETFNNEGFNVRWDNEKSTCIEVLPKEFDNFQGANLQK